MKSWVKVLSVLALLALMAGGVALYLHAEGEKQRQRALAHEAYVARREREAQERAVAAVAAVEDESRRLMPALIAGVAIGLDENELRHVRPRLRIARHANEPGRTWLEEDLSNGAQILYSLDAGSHRVLQVQILSILPRHDAIAPHLTAMNDQYGTPTGVWDCPASDGLITRRFTWRKNLASVMDVFLIYGDRISLTLYIAPTETIQQSLARAACRPVTRENLDAFPVVTPEAMRARANASTAGSARNLGDSGRASPNITVRAQPGHP